MNTYRPEPRPGDVLDALNELGLISASQAKVSGSEVYVLCPYHEDTSIGSFAINTETGLNHCFACGNGGSFHRFLMASRGMDRQQARRWCLNRLIPTTAPDRQHKQDAPEITEASLALFTGPPQEQLTNRGITMQACRALGILWDPARGSWIFPVRDQYGRLLGWQQKNGRFMSNRPDSVPVKSCLFGWSSICYGTTVALVESPLDTAVMYDAGYLAVSSYGSEVSDAQLTLITENCTALVLALDDDTAGWKATDKIMRRLRSIPVRVFNYGDGPGKDPGEMNDASIRRGMTSLLC